MELRIFVEPQQGATYGQQLAMARAAEDGGFDAFFRSDHFLRIGPGDPGPGPTDSWVTLGGIARETSRIRLGTMVTSATFRLPGPLAVAVAQVDEMSGGRVELGIGAGWYDTEHRAYGVPFPQIRERFDRLEEQLEIITGLWATQPGERFSFDGGYYAVADSPALPRPVQRPRPPIIVGGTGARRTPAIAARFADEFNVAFSSADRARELFERARAACVQAGRDPAGLLCSVALTVCCGKDEAQAAQRAANIGQSLDALREAGLAGTPAEVVDRLALYGPDGAGATRVYLQVLDIDDLAHIDLVAAEVLGRVR